MAVQSHCVAGTIFIIYDQKRSDIRNNISKIELQHQNLILSSSAYYLSGGITLQVSTVLGEAKNLTALADMLTSIKGIRHGKLLMSRAE